MARATSGFAVYRVALLWALLGLQESAAAIITVTSTQDNLTVNGQVTLREAIQAANTDTSVDGSVAGLGADNVVFDPTVFATPQTIVLGSTLPGISSAAGLTITGPVGGVTISGGGSVRVMIVSAGGLLSLQGLTVANALFTSSDGTLGGGISNSGTLHVNGCTFTNNRATGSSGGAIANSSTLTVTGSTFSGNNHADNLGGAIVGATSGQTTQVTGCTAPSRATRPASAEPSLTWLAG